MSKDLLLPIVKQTLEKYSVVHRIIECNPDLADTATFCQKYGYKPEESANTLVVTSRKVEPTVYAVCVVLAIDRLDVNNVVRKKMGVKKCSFADGETTVELTGMMIGGVTAVGIEDIPIYIDANVMKAKQIIMGGGNRSTKIILSPDELRKLPNVEVVEALTKVS